MSYLPLDFTNAVTTIHARTQIDAPVSTVWDIILDFPSYPLWNTFVRSQAITDEYFKPLLAHSTPKEGDHILLHVRVPPVGLHDNDKGLRSTKVVITHVDEAHHRVAWNFVGLPRWLLRSERWQEVSEERIDGRTVTTYTTTEGFYGIAAWFVRWFFRPNLVISFRTMARDLKTRSEELAAQSRAN